MSIVGLIMLMVIMAVLHEIGHAVVLKHYEIPYDTKYFSITFDDTKLTKAQMVSIIYGGIALGFIPFLFVVVADPMPELIIIMLMVWYLICCRHDLKLLLGVVKNAD